MRDTTDNSSSGIATPPTATESDPATTCNTNPQPLWPKHTWAMTDQRDLRQALAPLLRCLRVYDDLRTNLEQKGGQTPDLERITQAINRPFRMRGTYRAHEVRLTDPVRLRAAINDAAAGAVHLQVRMLPTNMPVYYLCRVRQDFWAEYSLVVQDLYTSPGYPMSDPRFVSLMRAGRETYFIRLSPYRDGASALLGPDRGELDWEVDRVLHTVGRHVFDVAWHEDQRPGMLAAQCFDMPLFKHAIEVLYATLGSDLCALRNIVDDTVLRFFRDVYQQPAIAGLLELLVLSDGQELSAIPERALTQYSRLTTAFGRFLQTEVTWGADKHMAPLYKPMFANFGRLDMLAPVVRRQKKARRARLELEATSEDVVRVILSGRSQADLPE